MRGAQRVSESDCVCVRVCVCVCSFLCSLNMIVNNELLLFNPPLPPFLRINIKILYKKVLYFPVFLSFFIIYKLLPLSLVSQICLFPLLQSV